jgi:hypothetical protein
MQAYALDSGWDAAEHPQRQAARRYRRYKCGGPAEIRVYPEGIETKGAMIDLSVHGCCVQLGEPLAVGAFARVEILFQVKGSTMRLGGVIRHRQEDLRTGIEFTNLSIRKSEEVRTAVRELYEAQTQQGYIGSRKSRAN